MVISVITPWSPAAIFLNAACYFSVKWKFEGEQAVRHSGLDYVIVRPFGLYDAPRHGSPARGGVQTSQGKTGNTRRSIAREQVATICHQALRMPAAGQHLTFECWGTEEHNEPVPWASLLPDPDEGVADVNHSVATATGVGVVALTGGCTVRAVAYGISRLLRVLRPR